MKTMLTVSLVFIICLLTLLGIANSTAITISPSRVEYFANPGGRVADDINIKTDSDNPIKMKVSINSFKSENGSIVEGDDGRSCVTWIQVASPNFIVNQEKKVRYLVNVPKNTPMGSYYASFVFTQDTMATVKGSILVYAYVTVGKPNPKGEIVEFKIDPSSEGLGFLVALKNISDFHFRSKGTLTLTNFQNGKLKFGTKEIIGEFPILPNSEKIIKIPVKKAIPKGEWMARLIIDTGNRKLQKELKFNTQEVMPVQ